MPRSYEPHELRDAQEEIDAIIEIDGEGSDAYELAVQDLNKIQQDQYTIEDLLMRLDKEESWSVEMDFKIPGSRRKERGKLMIKRIE